MGPWVKGQEPHKCPTFYIRSPIVMTKSLVRLVSPQGVEPWTY
jgi:hypothetical protein